MPTLTERFVADIEGLSDLPSLSPVLAHLIATLGREDASVAEVAAIIRQDPVIAARVLRAANSAAYIGRSPVSSIRDALLRLGLARIRRLALGGESVRCRARSRHAGRAGDLLATQPRRRSRLGDHRALRGR